MGARGRSLLVSACILCRRRSRGRQGRVRETLYTASDVRALTFLGGLHEFSVLGMVITKESAPDGEQTPMSR